MSKKTTYFLCCILILSLTSVAFWQIFPDFFKHFPQNWANRTPTLASSEAYQLRQIITANSSNSRTFIWQSDLSQTAAFLEYRTKGSNDLQKLFASNEEFSDNKQTSYLHKITLTNLNPATSYEYRIGWQNKRSPWYQFKTTVVSPANFKALIFPDSQSSDYTTWKTVAQAAWKNNNNADFLISLGDLVDNGEDQSQWRAWFNGVQDIVNHIPLSPVLGNHETYDLNWKTRMPLAYLKLFALPTNDNPLYQNQYYAYDYGDVHFVVLNTQLEELSKFQPEMLATQLAWLRQDLATTKQKWKIVLMHKDPLQYAIKNRANRQAGFSTIGKIFMPIFDEFGVDVVFSAHLHTYRRRLLLKNFKPDQTGSLYILTGVAGNVRYPDFWENHPLDDFIAPQPESNNYLTLERQENKLIITAFLPSGTALDQVILAK